jgi:hypothetical protein
MGLSLLGALAGLAGAVGVLLGGGPGSLAIVGAVPFVGFALFWWGHRKFPIMNDITTDLDDPPGFEAAAELVPNRGRDLTHGASDAAMQRDHYPTVQPFRTRAVVEAVWTHAKQAGLDSGWDLHHVRDDERRFEAVAVAGQFRFRDDVSVRVRHVDGVSVLDVRAKSRVGRGDFGANAERVLDFIAAVRARLPADLQIES